MTRYESCSVLGIIAAAGLFACTDAVGPDPATLVPADTVDGVAFTTVIRPPASGGQSLTLDSAVIDSGASRSVIRGAGSPFLAPLSGDSAGFFRVSTLPLPAGAHVIRMHFKTGGGSPIVVGRSFFLRTGELSYRLSELPDLGFGAGDALDINDFGQIVGWVRRADGTPEAFGWMGSSASEFPGDGSAVVRAISEAGHSVGGAATLQTGPAYEWIGPRRRLLADSVGAAIDLNDQGAVLTSRFLVSFGVPQRLPAAIDPASHINSRGQIIGVGHTSRGDSMAVGAGITILPPPPLVAASFPASRADAMNDLGQVVGRSLGRLGQVYLADDGKPGMGLAAAFGPIGCDAARCSDPTPVAITNDGTMLVFNQPDNSIIVFRNGRANRVRIAETGWRVETLHAMNASGVIVGVATNTATGRRWAVALSPLSTTEP